MEKCVGKFSDPRIAESVSNRAIEFRRSHFITVSPYRNRVKTEERSGGGGGPVNLSLVFECEWPTTRREKIER